MIKVLIFLILSICIISCESSLELVNDKDSNDDTAQRSTPRDPQGNDNPDPDDIPSSITLNAYEKEIFKLVNEHRVNLGKNKLLWHDSTIVESQDHSQDMASFRVPFGHIGFSERIRRIKAHDDDTIKSSGENVAQNSTAQRAFNAWLRSLGHRRNIEGDYTHTGIGAVKSANGSWYFTQIFLKK